MVCLSAAPTNLAGGLGQTQKPICMFATFLYLIIAQPIPNPISERKRGKKKNEEMAAEKLTEFAFGDASHF